MEFELSGEPGSGILSTETYVCTSGHPTVFYVVLPDNIVPEDLISLVTVPGSLEVRDEHGRVIVG